MKWLLLVLLAIGGYWFWQQYVQNREVRENAPLPEADQPAKPTALTCRYCDGLGKLVDESGVKKVGYRCPICDGMGKRVLPINQTACSYCNGFGRVPMQTPNNTTHSHRMIAQRCPICEGSGFKPVK